jgi:hypothetical protein
VSAGGAGNDQGMTSPSDDLVATEGVDEGSAASTAEGATSTEELTGVQNPIEQALGEPRSASPASETDPAPPDDMESGDARAARDATGTGQQLQAGEG